MERTSLERFISEIEQNQWKLGLSFVLIFTITLVILNAVGLVPEPVSEESRPRAALGAASTTTVPSYDTVPRRVVIESVDIDVNVLAPQSRSVEVLDKALLSGAVLYPGSGGLTDTSNLFIFGHSSFLPVVNNENFRAFNHLEKVKAGDFVRVESSDTANLYRVAEIRLVNAEAALVELSNRKKMLTLSTCNSFGEKSERYVVTAEFVDSSPLGKMPPLTD